MKQLLKDIAGFGAITLFLISANSWAAGSTIVPIAFVEGVTSFADLGVSAFNRVRFWSQHLPVFEICALVYALWVSASVAAFLVWHRRDGTRGLIGSTLMFGSFASTALTMAIIVFAGVRA